jgi:hypothetical protein
LSDTESSYDARAPRDRRLRVADSDRNAVADILRHEHVAGRIDSQEFEERLSACLAAKTYADLDTLIADFPAEDRNASRRLRPLTSWPSAFPFFPLVPIAIAAIVLSHGHLFWLAIPLVFFFVVRPLIFGAGWWGPRRYTFGGASRGLRNGCGSRL